MAKQWATRVIVAFQTACWCIAILLLLSRGISNLQASFAPPSLPRMVFFNNTANTTVAQADPRSRGYALGVGLIMVAVLMIAASPIILVARACDRRRYRSVEQFPDLGLPPRYEDIVSRAPSYSSLFNTNANERNDRCQELEELTPTANITIV